MAEFRRIQITLFVILLLQCTAVAGQNPLSFTVRAGDEVTLPCEYVIIQDKCSSTTWLWSHKGEAVVELVGQGQIKDEIPRAKSDRLSVTEKCSLVMKNVTEEDVSRYTCRQFNKPGPQQGPDAVVHLSVVNMVEQKYTDDTVTLICSVLTYDQCDHTVKWLYEGNENVVEIPPLTCSASVSFPPHLNQKLLKCNVTDEKNGNTLQFDVMRNEKTGNHTKEDDNTSKQDWWRVIMVSVGLAALIITVVVVNIWMRTKGNRTQMDGNAEHRDEDEGTVTYENAGEPSASIRLH